MLCHMCSSEFLLSCVTANLQFEGREIGVVAREVGVIGMAVRGPRSDCGTPMHRPECGSGHRGCFPGELRVGVEPWRSLNLCAVGVYTE